MTAGSSFAARRTLTTLGDFYLLCKPRVTSLVVFTALAAMLIATPDPPPAGLILSAMAGIALVTGSAAALNCAIERCLDATMTRTRARPLASGRLGTAQALWFAALIGASGLAILYIQVNALTMFLALGSLVGYAFVYTVILKPRTVQNIVIGGAAGAMPPVMGWSAATAQAIALEPLLLFLIVFAWTPPHFWSLALYHKYDYINAGVPMLPAVCGEARTRTHIVVYTLVLFALSVMPYVLGMSGWLYLLAALSLGSRFIYHAARLYLRHDEALALATFKYSVIYLFAIFAALIVDHYLGKL